MSNVAQNVKSDTSEGDNRGLEDAVGLTSFMFALNKDHAKKLHEIMENRKHYTFGDTIRELIVEEHSKIGVNRATL